MAADVEAVVAALRVALDEAQNSDELYWKVEASNRWLGQLPGAWTGRWRKLILGGDSAGETLRENFVGHVRAVIAFLETNRAQAPAKRRWWSPRRRSTSIQAAAQAVATPVRAPAKPINLLRVRKPMPGLH
jgi:hypothetical protein